MHTNHIEAFRGAILSAGLTPPDTISDDGKLIRFKVEEIPPKEGVVQGVNCMGLRSDSVQTAVATRVTP